MKSENWWFNLLNFTGFWNVFCWSFMDLFSQSTLCVLWVIILGSWWQGSDSKSLSKRLSLWNKLAIITRTLSLWKLHSILHTYFQLKNWLNIRILCVQYCQTLLFRFLLYSLPSRTPREGGKKLLKTWWN